MCCDSVFLNKESKTTNLVTNATGNIFHKSCWINYCNHRSNKNKGEVLCPISRENIPKTAFLPTKMTFKVFKKRDSRRCDKCCELFKRLLARRDGQYVEPIIATKRGNLFHKKCFEESRTEAREKNLYPKHMPSPCDGVPISYNQRPIDPFTRRVLSALPVISDIGSRKEEQAESKEQTALIKQVASSVDKPVQDLLKKLDIQNNLLKKSLQGAQSALDASARRVLMRDRVIAHLFRRIASLEAENRALQAESQQQAVSRVGSVFYQCAYGSWTFLIRVYQGTCYVVSETYNKGRELVFGESGDYTVTRLRKEAPLEARSSARPSSRSANSENQAASAV